MGMERRTACLAGLLIGLALMGPVPSSAQSGGSVDGKLSVGVGSRLSGALEAELGLWLVPGLAATARYTRRTRGHECDTDDWPASYRCSVRGQAFAAGVRVSPLRGGSHFLPYVGASAGAFRRDGRAGPPPVAALAGVELGVLIPVSSRMGFIIEYGTDWMFDSDYEALMGHRLQYTTASGGVAVRIR